MPPHFHAIGPDSEAFIEISTLTVMHGALPAAARRAVLRWAEANRPTLMAEWNRCNPPVR